MGNQFSIQVVSTEVKKGTECSRRMVHSSSLGLIKGNSYPPQSSNFVRAGYVSHLGWFSPASLPRHLHTFPISTVSMHCLRQLGGLLNESTPGNKPYLAAWSGLNAKSPSVHIYNSLKVTITSFTKHWFSAVSLSKHDSTRISKGPPIHVRVLINPEISQSAWLPLPWWVPPEFSELHL